jgi:serine/threonine-protein kinase
VHSEPPALAEGQRLLDRYVIIDKVAEGGMARIYRATDERLDRVVCVKLLREDLAAEGGSTSGRQEFRATYRHFLKEALALSRLQHPNTLRIYDFGYLEGTSHPFQIAEFCDGGNLEQHVRARGALDTPEVLAIVEAVAGALEEAHEKGIVHRDVKPSNILFGRVAGRMIPKLADFGIARSEHKRIDPDSTDEVVSTVTLFSPRWAAPEQIGGGPIGTYTDVYALGLVTAFMLCGVPLFEGKSVRSTYAERIVGDNLVKNRLVQTGTPHAAIPVLLHALAARVSERTKHPHELFEELRDALSEPQSAARPRHESYVSISYEQEIEGGIQPERAVEIPACEEVWVGDRRVQLLDVEPLDLAVPTGRGFDARVRVTLVWDRDSIRLNLKGLNCFIVRRGAGPSPAIVTKDDGMATFLSTAREQLGQIIWSFGQVGQQGRVFHLGDRQMVVPYTRASYAVALDVGQPHPVVIVCKR